MENKEIQIRVSDILASFLKAIVPIVLVTVFFGGLLGVWGIYRARKVSKDPNLQKTINTLKTQIEDKNTALKHLTNANDTILNETIPYLETKIDVTKKRLESQKAYLSESIYYNINPYDCGISRIAFTIDIPVPAEAQQEYAQFRSTELSRLVNTCTKMYPLSDADMVQMRNLFHSEADAKYIDELVSIVNTHNEVIEIRVVYTDSAVAKKVADYLFEYVTTQLKELSPDCVISTVSSYTGNEVNMDMNKSQTSYQNEILTSDKNLAADRDLMTQSYNTYDTNKKSIEDLNKEISSLNSSLASNERKLTQSISKRSLLKSGIKFGIIGALIAMVVSCVCVFVKDFLGGKVRSRNSLLTRYSYPLLGVMPGSKKYLFDKTVKRLEGDSIYEKKDIIASSSASILAAVEADGGKTCLIGPIDEKDPAFSDLLKSLKGKVEYKGNILSGSEAVKNLGSYDKVILVEKRCESRYDSIAEEISRIRAIHKDVLGFVLL